MRPTSRRVYRCVKPPNPLNSAYFGNDYAPSRRSSCAGVSRKDLRACGFYLPITRRGHAVARRAAYLLDFYKAVPRASDNAPRRYRTPLSRTPGYSWDERSLSRCRLWPCSRPVRLCGRRRLFFSQLICLPRWELLSLNAFQANHASGYRCGWIFWLSSRFCISRRPFPPSGFSFSFRCLHWRTGGTRRPCWRWCLRRRRELSFRVAHGRGPVSLAERLALAGHRPGTDRFRTGYGISSARERGEHLAHQQFFEKITGHLQFDRGLTESIRLVLGELAVAFECEQACLAVQDDELDRLFVWRVCQSDRVPRRPEVLSLGALRHFLDGYTGSFPLLELQEQKRRWFWVGSPHRKAVPDDCRAADVSTRDEFEARSLLAVTLETARAALRQSAAHQSPKAPRSVFVRRKSGGAAEAANEWVAYRRGTQ